MERKNDIHAFDTAFPGIKEVLMLFSAVTAIFITVGSRVQGRDLYSGIIITEFALILLPGLLLLIARRLDIREALRLRPLSLAGTLLIPMLIVFSLPLVGVFNFLNLLLVKLIFGTTQVAQIPAATDFNGLILNLAVIAVAPAVCEETLFRGVIQKGLERLGKVRAILVASFLFTLLHVDMQKLLGIFALGCLIGFIVYRTNSLYSGILAHFTNNAFGVLVTYTLTRMVEVLEKSGMADMSPAEGAGDVFSVFSEMPSDMLVAVIIVMGIIVFISTSVFITLVVAFIKNTEGGKKEDADLKPGKLRSFLWLLPGLLLIGFIYFSQGVKLLGIENEAVEAVLGVLTGRRTG